jgi:hypothetical protein
MSPCGSTSKSRSHRWPARRPGDTVGHRPARNQEPSSAAVSRGRPDSFEFVRHLKLREVIENRGGIGVGGERLLRVRVGVPTTDALLEFEIRAADVKSAA